MQSFLLAVTASVCWGISDFLGGFKARAVPVLRVLAISQPAGLVLVSVAVIGWGHGLPTGSAAVLAAAAGACSIAALGMLYAAMTRESMIVAVPLAATGSIIPVVAGLVRGEVISPAAAAGIALALLGAPVAAWEPGAGRRPGHSLLGAALAVGAGTAGGAWLTLMNLASTGNPAGATQVMRLTSCVIAVTLVAFRGRSQVRRPLSRRPSGRLRGPLTEAREPPGLGTVAFLAIAAIGVTDALGEICFAGASAGGQLSIVSPLSSLYPAVTVLLAAAALRERVHPVQALGAAGALTGAVLLAL